MPPRPSGPTRLRVPDLLHATDQAADDVLSGRCDHLLPGDGVPESERWFTRIHGDDELDVWLISWVPGHATELHDHGGSLGALTVLSGSLNEFRWDGKKLRRRRLDAGDQAGFPLGWVHDVVWAPRAAPTRVGSRTVAADPERACLLAAADGDVLLRGHRAQQIAPPAHRIDRPTGGVEMSRIDRVLRSARRRYRRLSRRRGARRAAARSGARRHPAAGPAIPRG